MKVGKHLQIVGLVQGVYYRESFRQRAEALNVSGWVRNRLDGSVEAMIHGEENEVALLIEWAQRGPEQANVERIDISDSAETFIHFEKRPTI
ncbi:MAG: Acylphosphatase [Pseudomonadota bacterium]|jgi:acylphosphatase